MITFYVYASILQLENVNDPVDPLELKVRSEAMSESI